MPSRPKGSRLYDDPRWRKRRKGYLQRNPLCALCLEMDRLTPATIVDHVEPHRGDPVKFWDERNWQSACKPCHDGAKQQLEKSGGLRGSSTDGVPLDPAHHWNR